MRTTIRLDEHLLQQAKKHAAQSGRTLTRLIEDALRQELHRRPTTRAGRAVKLPTYKGRGLGPGVDLDDSAALLDTVES